jgi:hypothetical protein
MVVVYQFRHLCVLEGEFLIPKSDMAQEFFDGGSGCTVFDHHLIEEFLSKTMKCWVSMKGNVEGVTMERDHPLSKVGF